MTAIQIAVRWHKRARLFVIGTLAWVTLDWRIRDLLPSWMERIPAGADRSVLIASIVADR
ncbi:hypothetical protein EP7_002363 [Isosphaeraceae bacterium EP7]